MVSQNEMRRIFHLIWSRYRLNRKSYLLDDTILYKSSADFLSDLVIVVSVNGKALYVSYCCCMWLLKLWFGEKFNGCNFSVNLLGMMARNAPLFLATSFISSVKCAAMKTKTSMSLGWKKALFLPINQSIIRFSFICPFFIAFYSYVWQGNLFRKSFPFKNLHRLQFFTTQGTRKNIQERRLYDL